MINQDYANVRLKSRLRDIENYSGPLGEELRQFVLQKRALGLKYNGESHLLGVFDKFLYNNNAPEKKLLKESVIEFCAKRPNESHKSFSNRGVVIRQFGEYLGISGYESYVLPFYTAHRSPFVPYIYSHNEIKKIFEELDKREYSWRSRYAHKVYPMLFRVLYGCGMRINEALGLKVSDIDFKNGVFRLTETKYSSERLVPMSDSLLSECHQYFNELHYANEHKYFFPSPSLKTNCAASYRAVHGELKRILRICGIPEKARIHDFRHTFSVHLLNRWANEGRDIYVCLPLLSKYLGHSTISGTEIYLRLTAEIYPEVVQTFEKHFGEVIPEVNFYETN